MNGQEGQPNFERRLYSGEVPVSTTPLPVDTVIANPKDLTHKAAIEAANTEGAAQ